MQEIKLPSGAVLKMGNTPFAVSKALYQSVLEELKGVSLDSKTELSTLYKELFCIGFSSKKIEACLYECFKRCLYFDGSKELKIEESTFEPEEARQDYMMVCMEVGKFNILPFGKSLWSEFQRILKEMTEGSQKSSS